MPFKGHVLRYFKTANYCPRRVFIDYMLKCVKKLNNKKNIPKFHAKNTFPQQNEQNQELDKTDIYPYEFINQSLTHRWETKTDLE